MKRFLTTVLTTLKKHRKSGTSVARRRPVPLQMECLEDRFLPSGNSMAAPFDVAAVYGPLVGDQETPAMTSCLPVANNQATSTMTNCSPAVNDVQAVPPVTSTSLAPDQQVVDMYWKLAERANKNDWSASALRLVDEYHDKIFNNGSVQSADALNQLFTDLKQLQRGQQIQQLETSREIDQAYENGMTALKTLRSAGQFAAAGITSAVSLPGAAINAAYGALAAKSDGGDGTAMVEGAVTNAGVAAFGEKVVVPVVKQVWQSTVQATSSVIQRLASLAGYDPAAVGEVLNQPVSQVFGSGGGTRTSDTPAATGGPATDSTPSPSQPQAAAPAEPPADIPNAQAPTGVAQPPAPLKFGPDDLVYGLSNGPSADGTLRALQQQAGGKLLVDIMPPGLTNEQIIDFSIAKMEEALAKGNKIHFDLTHMEDLPGVLNNTGPFDDAVTSQELRYLSRFRDEFKDTVKYYIDNFDLTGDW